MSRQRTARDGSPQVAGDDAHRRLLAGVPVTERRMVLAGVSTAVLEGGDSPPLVLLCGQGGWAGVWPPAIAELVGTYHVVAPDLPGLGASQTPQRPPPAPPWCWPGSASSSTRPA